MTPKSELFNKAINLLNELNSIDKLKDNNIRLVLGLIDKTLSQESLSYKEILCCLHNTRASLEKIL